MVAPLNRAWLDCLPADCTRYSNLQVQADGQPWLLVASRVHPTTGQLNALLLSPDRRRLVMAPVGEVAGFPVEEGGHSVATPELKGPHQVSTPELKGVSQVYTPGEQPVVEPAAVVSLPVAAAKVPDFCSQKSESKKETPKLFPEKSQEINGEAQSQGPKGFPQKSEETSAAPAAAKPTAKPRARAKTPLDAAANKLAREFKGEVIAVDPIGHLLEQELGLPEGSCG